MHIVVLCGGLYPERDVSIVSGRQIAKALTERGHRVLLMDLFFGYTRPYTDPLEAFDGSLEGVPDKVGSQAPDLEAVSAMRPGPDTGPVGPHVFGLCKAADIVFMALHGEDGENGKLQAAFDLMGIRYTGTGYFGSALAMHKGVSRTLFSASGIQVPPGKLLRTGEDPGTVPYPCVVKPCSGGSSVGTTIVGQPKDLDRALEKAFRLEAEILIEAYISGREFSVGILDGKALPVIEICPKSGFYSYENKYQAGFTDETCPAELPERVTTQLQETALCAHKSLRLGVYSRTDFILSHEGELYCLESNTLPGMTPLSLLPQEAQAAGLDFGDLCEKIIAVSMERLK